MTNLKDLLTQIYNDLLILNYNNLKDVYTAGNLTATKIKNNDYDWTLKNRQDGTSLGMASIKYLIQDNTDKLNYITYILTFYDNHDWNISVYMDEDAM